MQGRGLRGNIPQAPFSNPSSPWVGFFAKSSSVFCHPEVYVAQARVPPALTSLHAASVLASLRSHLVGYSLHAFSEQHTTFARWRSQVGGWSLSLQVSIFKQFVLPDLSPLITWWAGLMPNREKLSSTCQHVLKEYVASFLASSSSFLHPLSTAAHPHTVLQLAFFRNEASL